MLFQCKPKSHFLLFHAEICLCHFMKHGLWPVKYTRTQHPLSGTTWAGWYQKKHIHTHTDPDHQTSIINFLHPLWSIASSLFNLRAWQSSLTTSFQVLFDLPLGLWPSASYPIHFFTQSSSFCNTCPYHCRPFCCNTSVMSSIPNLSLITSEILRNNLQQSCHFLMLWLNGLYFNNALYGNWGLLSQTNKSVLSYLHTLTKWHCPHSRAATAATDWYFLSTAAGGLSWDRQTDAVLFHTTCSAGCGYRCRQWL